MATFFSSGVYGCRNTAAFSKTNNTLADVTGMLLLVEAGRTYQIEIYVQTTLTSPNGVQFELAGTAAAVGGECKLDMFLYNINAQLLGAVAQIVTFNAGGTGLATIGMTNCTMRMSGVFRVNTAGNIRLRFAQVNTNAASSDIGINGAFMKLIQLT